jgi:hypothetical protein
MRGAAVEGFIFIFTPAFRGICRIIWNLLACMLAFFEGAYLLSCFHLFLVLLFLLATLLFHWLIFLFVHFFTL